MIITPEEIINQYEDTRLRLAWVIDEDTLKSIRNIKFADGKYLWSPDLKYSGKSKPGTLLGIEVIITKERGLNLAIIKKDGSIQILKNE